jgi:voltage-gated potassium channel
MLLRPSVVSFLDVTTGFGDMTLRLEESEITNDSPLAGISLAQARIPQQTGLIVLALRRGGREGRVEYNPGPETRLDGGDVMIVLGRNEQVQRLREYVRRGPK